MVNSIVRNVILNPLYTVQLIIVFFSLMKDYTARPNYNQLLKLDFITEHAKKDINVAEFVGEILDLPEVE